MQEKQQEKSPIKQKILLYLANKGVTPYEFYKISGVTRGILQQNNGISEENITRFLAYATDVSPAWLLTGEGSMLKTKCTAEAPSEAKTAISEDKDTEKSENHQIPSQEYLALLSAFREQATEIGRLQERIRQQERDLERLASDARTSDIAGAG